MQHDTSLGVLATAVAAAAVYGARAVLIRVLIALFLAISLDSLLPLVQRLPCPFRLHSRE